MNYIVMTKSTKQDTIISNLSIFHKYFRLSRRIRDWLLLVLMRIKMEKSCTLEKKVKSDKKIFSNCTFRSCDLRVMSPAG